jgi:hypothetical protein
MDVVSDLLSVIRLSGAVFFRTELSEPWHITSPSSNEIGAMFEVGPRQILPFATIWEISPECDRVAEVIGENKHRLADRHQRAYRYG